MKTLYLIGNGFDLHHRIKSGYCNYMDWLKIHHPNVYNKVVEIYGKEALDWEWWSDLETNLGYPPNLDEYAKEWADRNKPTREDFERDHYIDDNSARWDVQEELGGLINDIKSTFHEWIATGLNGPDEEAKITLDLNYPFFITFNYTETLENLYNLVDVFHIHGKIEKNSETEDFVLGHGRTLEDIKQEVIYAGIPEYDGKMSPKDYQSLISVDSITENAQEATCEELASLRKDVAGIIQQNKAMFESMVSVQSVYIYGLSFGDVDKDYLVEVFKYVPNTAIITINYFGTTPEKEDEAKAKIACVMNNLGRNNYKLIKLSDILAPSKYSLF